MMLEASSEFRVPSSEGCQPPGLPQPQSEADLLIYCESPLRAAVICPDCLGSGFRSDSWAMMNGRHRKPAKNRHPGSCPVGCDTCDGAGYLGIDGRLPTSCKAGSEGKIAVLAARYAQGQPLWLAGDRDLRDIIPQCGPMNPALSVSEDWPGVDIHDSPTEFEESFEDEDELVADAA